MPWTPNMPCAGRVDGDLRRRGRPRAARSCRELGHRSRPFIAEVGGAASAASSSSATCARALRAELLVLDLVVELEDRVHEHLRPRRAAREVHVDRHDVVDALDDRVVVEHAARGRRRHPWPGPTWAPTSGRRSDAGPAPSSGSRGRRRSSGRPGAARRGRPPCRSGPGRSDRRRSPSSRWRSRPGRRWPATASSCGSSRPGPRRWSAAPRSGASPRDPSGFSASGASHGGQSHSSPPRRHT